MRIALGVAPGGLKIGTACSKERLPGVAQGEAWKTPLWDNPSSPMAMPGKKMPFVDGHYILEGICELKKKPLS